MSPGIVDMNQISRGKSPSDFLDRKSFLGRTLPQRTLQWSEKDGFESALPKSAKQSQDLPLTAPHLPPTINVDYAHGWTPSLSAIADFAFPTLLVPAKPHP